MLEITTHTPPDADGWEVKHLHTTDQSLDLVEITMGGDPVELTAHEALSLVRAVTAAAMGALG